MPIGNGVLGFIKKPSGHSEDSQSIVFNDVDVTTTFDTSYGRCVLPVAGEDGKDTPPEVVDLHNTLTHKIIDYTIEVIGDELIIPKVDTGEPTDTLLRTVVIGNAPIMVGGSQVATRVTIRYIYAVKKAFRPGDVVKLGKNPMSKRAANENVVPKDAWAPILGAGKKVPKPFGNNISGGNRKSENE